MLDVVGEHRFLVYKVIKFLRSHVYTWETLYLHYMRKDVMHFDVSQHTSTLLQTLAYWYDGGNNMNSATLA